MSRRQRWCVHRLNFSLCGSNWRGPALRSLSSCPGCEDRHDDSASEGAISLMTTDELVKQSFASVKVGALEIRPGSTRHVRCLAACRSEQSARVAHSTSPLAT